MDYIRAHMGATHVLIGVIEGVGIKRVECPSLPCTVSVHSSYFLATVDWRQGVPLFVFLFVYLLSMTFQQKHGIPVVHCNKIKNKVKGKVIVKFILLEYFWLAGAGESSETHIKTNNTLIDYALRDIPA